MIAFVFDRRSLVLLGTGAVFLALVLVAVGFLLGVQYGVLPPAASPATTAQANQTMLPTRVTGMADDANAPDAGAGFDGSEGSDNSGGTDTEPVEGDGAAEAQDRSAAESLPYTDGPADEDPAMTDEAVSAAPASPRTLLRTPAAAPADPIIDSRGGEPVALAPSPPSVPDRPSRPEHLEDGIAEPRAEGAAPDAPAAVSAAVTSDFGRFAVQVGAYRERLNCDAMVQKLSARGFEPYVVEIERDGQAPLYAVRVGRFGERGAAARAASALRSKAGVSVVVLSIG